MGDVLCIFNNMNKCAKQFCNMWSYEEEMCGYAAESSLRIKILRNIDHNLEASKLVAKETLYKYISNIIKGEGQTIH